MIAIDDGDGSATIKGRRTSPKLFRLAWDECVLQNPTLETHSLARAGRAITHTLLWGMASPEEVFGGIANTWAFLAELPTRGAFLSVPGDSRPVWVPRVGAKFGLLPHSLGYDLEQDRMRHPGKFAAVLVAARLENGKGRVAARRCAPEPMRATMPLWRIRPATHEATPIDGARDRVVEFRSSAPAVASPDHASHEARDVVKLIDAEVLHGTVVTYRGHIYPTGADDASLLDSPRMRLDDCRREGSGHLTIPGTPLGVTHQVREAGFIGASKSWYHFLVEGGERLHLLHEVLGHGVPLVVSGGMPSQLLEAIRELTGTEAVTVPPFTRVRVETLYAVRENRMPVGLSRRWNPAALSWVREKLIAESIQDEDRSKRVHLMRNSSYGRPLQNSLALRRLLNKRGFVTVDPETCSMRQQVDLMTQAAVVVAESGAALTSVMFCNPGTRVLELHPPLEPAGFWGAFSEHFALEHDVVSGKQCYAGKHGIARDGWSVNLRQVTHAIDV